MVIEFFQPNGVLDASKGMILAAGTPMSPILFGNLNRNGGTACFARLLASNHIIMTKSIGDPATAAGRIIVGKGGFSYSTFQNLQSVEGIPDDHSLNGFTACTFASNQNAAMKFTSTPSAIIWPGVISDYLFLRCAL